MLRLPGPDPRSFLEHPEVSKRLHYAEINDRLEAEDDPHLPQRWLDEGERRRRPHSREWRESEGRGRTETPRRRDREAD
jgi:hypothetical protein